MGPEQKLLASDPGAGDSFGYNVSVSGERAIVGAFADTDNGVESGSAYVFERQANGVWQETHKLIASDGATFERFGFSVSISGDHALVGAWSDDDNGSNSGSAYVFERQANGTWLEAEKLLSSGAHSFFGWSVSIFGERALIGAEGAGNGSSTSGAAFLFERQANGKWLKTHKLLASDGADSDSFGFAVSLAEEHAIIGAYRDDGAGPNYGSAYVFERQGNGAWLEAHKLTAPDGADYDNFAAFAATTDGHAFISSSSDDDNGENSGSAHVFDLADCALNIGFQGPGNLALSICGDDLTLPASSAMLRIDNAVPNSFVMLFGGLTNNPTAVPTTLGTLVPVPVLPGFPLIFPVGPNGSLSFGVSGGPLLPTTVYLQLISQTGPLVQFSNAVKVTIGT